MLTFFRKFRIKQLVSGRTSRYVLYAIGEIALVVIGILIALQVNNWNEERKAEQLELVTLQELRNNIEANVQEIDSVFKRVDTRVKSIQILLNNFSQQSPMSDSLVRHFSWATGYDRINLHVGAYNSYISAGSQIIKDEKLRFEINTYFDNALGELKGFIEELRDDFYSYMLGYQRNEFTEIRSQDKIAIPRSYDKLRLNESFILSMGIFLDVQLSARSCLNRTRDKSLRLLTEIDRRITEIE